MQHCSRLSDPSSAFTGYSVSPPDYWNTDPLLNDGGVGSAHNAQGEYLDGSPQSAHTYNHSVVVPGGTNNKGLHVNLLQTYAYGQHNTGWSHAADLGIAGTPVSAAAMWTRKSTNQVFGGANLVEMTSCYDVSRNRAWLFSGNTMAYLDLVTDAWTVVSINAINAEPIVACQYPVNDYMLSMGWEGGYNAPHTFNIYAVSLSTLTVHRISLSGFAIPTSLYPTGGFDWDTDQGVGYVLLGSNSTPDYNHVYQITPPAVVGNWLTQPWVVAQIKLPETLGTDGGIVIESRWRYIPTIKKFCYVYDVNSQMTLWTPPS
jgi:hypothetical protein